MSFFQQQDFHFVSRGGPIELRAGKPTILVLLSIPRYFRESTLN
jgi:hypothetical protein